jgi:hypothetical protein
MEKLLKMMSLLLVMTMSFAVTSCGDDDDEETVNYYTAGFDAFNVSSSSSDLSGSLSSSLSGLTLIENAFVNSFKTELGVSGTSFSIIGETSATDAKVKAACEKAEQALSGTDWGGSYYTYVVQNSLTGKTIYSHRFE